MQVTTVGLDIAKNLFQVHGADAQGRPVLERKLARGKVLEFFANLPPCLVGLEACGAAHHWARELAKLGHTVRLMPPRSRRGSGWNWGRRSLRLVHRAMTGGGTPAETTPWAGFTHERGRR